MSSSPRFNAMYAPNQPQFFKIILDDSFCQMKLGIPRKFVRNYGKKLSNWVILKVPSGDNWKVDIVKLDGQVWLGKGLQSFMEYYSVVLGSLLVFRYDESNSGFNVSIFDRTCTEIDYPYNIINEVPCEPQVPKVESVEISPSRKRKVQSSLSTSWAYKKMKKVENASKKTGKGTNAETKKEHRSSLKKMVSWNVTSNKMYSTLTEKSKAIHRASSGFQSDIPTFQITMFPSHVGDNSSRPTIPASFARKYMKSKNGDALLNTLDGRTWSVKYSTGGNGMSLMHSGWNKFVRDCYLKVGDVCKFELIAPDKTLFRVVISRSMTGEIVGSSSKQSMDNKTSIILRKNSSSNSSQAAGKFTSGNPFFKVVIKSSNPERNTVNVPVCFFKNLKETEQYAKLVLYGKMWYVKLLLYRNHGCGTLSAGWTSFARENCLKVGDVCTFELIDAQELLMKVSVLRHSSTN